MLNEEKLANVVSRCTHLTDGFEHAAVRLVDVGNAGRQDYATLVCSETRDVDVRKNRFLTRYRSGDLPFLHPAAHDFSLGRDDITENAAWFFCPDFRFPVVELEGRAIEDFYS
jgi:hypothetical protein